MIFLFVFINVFSFNEDRTKNKTKKVNELNISKSERYINEFISSINPKGFTEAEITKKFVEMMKWCSEKDIYNKLFSKSLKEKLILEQFKNYKLNSFGIEGISAMLLADESIYISFIDSVNGGAYGIKVKDKAIIEFKKI